MLNNFGKVRSQIAQMCGIQDTNGNYDFDSTTQPDITLVNTFLNDAYREIGGMHDWTFLFTNRSYPFYHVISGVQSVDLYTSNRASGTITPYPNAVLNYSWLANNSVQDINNNFSGISYVGLSGTNVFSGVSTSGNVSYHNYTGVGFVYQLDPDIDKIEMVQIQQSVNGSSNAVILQHVDWHQMMKMFPIGTIASTGTNIFYSEFPGMSSDNNKVIQFAPQPDPVQFSGTDFIVVYKKRQEDLVLDTQVQTTIPEQFQYLINYYVAEKILDMTQNPKSNIFRAKKEEMLDNMKIWDFNQPDKMRFWGDYNERSSIGSTRSVYDSSSNIILP